MVNGVFTSPWTVEAKLGITDWALGLLWTAKGKYGTADGALGSLGTVEGKYGMADGALGLPWTMEGECRPGEETVQLSENPFNPIW